ncbi:bifunctional tRNA (5-methylaminomethyl-2-thiouridine)(34)-methyltransferase MnmD/FAD-dependent 5-carboxymethylaminomethyl-2-thiouridine(34) oxidoreductase MnmC [Campylobacter lari]|uniref:bifunctional tRNA (5-methylaminomethyl-2-thiouridine)(34)-methyltransferase MnmD/FAD-dependent 5-carboxymethylaminomethyl-2-thiouridine(34) oxidoreductase MnmC n=1 Tax=Campylobacter TaxID=194 RepID=UPI0012BED21D|nr:MULTISPECIES: bifunctional tRNA (5-methylaminomethyl-2-thiouridine)(34)-methyltransferase MnmD/FAD-dependent 5-carboxymethylaminomethyl-2-thiouridine(34) oxidoreductase MnmC [Campylobacter]EAK9882944.1 bifunctional tRNA (5-methylaminomethyl-2-thiouridine)(34)-methyltransferase MnmD/FAD-dependent 5-carboxymethylaminomethyl-2-thiouridine(34) oxidoreductase MnmC [Campylobacter lari]MBX1934457.1 bifunctional tRNA (5-methylaminomethyl-2-thiouridine)(34)-methyltransferase MnmD/FAD-dependent 5-carbox
MKKANIIIKNNAPFSLDFDDYYFNSSDGLSESKFIYTNAFDFENKQTIVAELGFGIGLNFFLTLKRFLKEKKHNQRLFYLSFENFYIEKDKLREIYKKLGFYEKFEEVLEQFLNFYPPCKDGVYRFYFQDCFLDLVLGDAKENLQILDFKANIWYLDGFSPSKNQDMFDNNIINNVAKNSKINAKILTFSSASVLKKALINNNFQVQKIKGFRKREMIQAIFNGLEFEDKFAYFNTPSLKKEIQKIAIIGAGIAGASMAYELSLRNVQVDVFEKENSLGKGASGNINGILSSLILKPDVLLGEFSQYAFLEASRFYRQILNLTPQGVYEFAHNELMHERFDSQKDNVLFEIINNQAFLKDGFCIKPQELVKTLLQKSKARVFFEYEFKDYSYKNEKFSLNFNNQKILKDYDVLIYAQGADVKNFLEYKYMKLSSVRGQCTHLKPFLKNPHALSSKGYICPINEELNLQLIGASYDRLNQDTTLLKNDDLQNIENVKEFLHDENLEIMGGKVGFRSYSSDRFAIAGQAYDENFYMQNYKALLWHKNKNQVIPNDFIPLYFSIAHGSRAFASAIVCARVMSSLIFDEPRIKKEFLYALHPARFLIRKLKKGLI